MDSQVLPAASVRMRAFSAGRDMCVVQWFLSVVQETC